MLLKGANVPLSVFLSFVVLGIEPSLCQIAQAGFELAVFLSQPPRVPGCLGMHYSAWLSYLDVRDTEKKVLELLSLCRVLSHFSGLASEGAGVLGIFAVFDLYRCSSLFQ